VKESVLNIDTIGFSSSHFRFCRCLDSKFDTVSMFRTDPFP